MSGGADLGHDAWDPTRTLHTFRDALRAGIVRRADALFELCDAILTSGVVPSTVHLLVFRCLVVDRRADFIRHTKHLTGLIRHDSKDALSRIELLLSNLEEGKSLNADEIAAVLKAARLEMYEVLKGLERIEELCERESESRRS